MAVVRACVYFIVIFLCFHVTVGKPMFGIFWCDLACVDDDDEITTTPESREPDIDDLFCGHCPPRRRRRTTTPNPLTGMVQPPNQPWQPPNQPWQPSNQPWQPAFDPRSPNKVNVNMWWPGGPVPAGPIPNAPSPSTPSPPSVEPLPTAGK